MLHCSYPIPPASLYAELELFAVHLGVSGMLQNSVTGCGKEISVGLKHEQMKARFGLNLARSKLGNKRVLSYTATIRRRRCHLRKKAFFKYGVTEKEKNLRKFQRMQRALGK